MLKTDALPDTERKVDTLQLFKSVFNAFHTQSAIIFMHVSSKLYAISNFRPCGH